MKAIGEILREKNIKLETLNPVLQGGFTQMPNFILREPALSIGAKIAYAMFSSYVWHNDSCFPGQDRLAVDMGLSRSRVTQLISELENTGLVTVQRRGQGKTNLYTVYYQVKSSQVKPNQNRPAGLTPQSAQTDENRNIILATDNAAVKGGFTQVPNFILRAADLSPGAKITYAMFISYAWHNDSCFPGQDRLAEDMGISRSRVSQLVNELRKAGLVSIECRGQGKTNIYTIHYQVKRASGQFESRNFQMLIS